MDNINTFLNKYDLFPVVPLLDGNKKPVLKWSDNKYRIFNDADLSEHKMNSRYMWIDKEGKEVKSRVSGYALLTGEISNTIVIDLDNKEGKNGEQIFYDLLKSTGLNKDDINTLETLTPTGGKHLYFKYKEGLKTTANIAEGVDIRANGGIILLPGTRIANKYYEVINDTNIIDMPDILFEHIKEKCSKENKNEDNSFDTGILLKTIKEGGRDNHLTRCCGFFLAKYPRLDKETFTLLVNGLNDKFAPKFTKEEIESKINHYWEDFSKGEMFFDWYDSDNKLMYIDLALYIQESHDLMFYDNAFYKYTDGVYAYMDENDLPTYLNKFIKKKDMRQNTYKELKTQLIPLIKISETDIKKDVINLSNGLLHISKDKIELKPHTKAFKSIYQIGIEYDPNLSLSDAPNFRDTILKMANGDKDILDLFQEIGGSALVPTSHLKKIFVLKGKTDTLKSGLIRGVQAVLGAKNYSLVSPGDMSNSSNSRFKVAELYNKLFNSTSEAVTKYVEDSNVIKTLTGDDYLTADKKWEKPITFRNTATHVFCFNGDVKFNNDGGAMTNRLTIIPCTYQIQDSDKIEGFYDRFDNESNAIFNWFLEGLQRLLNNGWKFTTPQSTLDATEEFDRNSNELKYWLLENVEQTNSNEDKISLRKLHNKYSNYLTLEISDKKADAYGYKFFKGDVKKLDYNIERLTKSQKLCSELNIDFERSDRNIHILRGYRIIE